jgi:hypothetical protein
MTTEISENRTIRFYIPEQAAHAPDVADNDLIDVIKQRSASEYGGYTTFEGSGGWLPDGSAETVEEPVTVVEVVADANADVEPLMFAKVNARYIHRATDEQMVMATVDNQTVVVE